MKRGDIIELTIDQMKYPVKGVGSYDGRKVEVKNTFKGQKVAVRVRKKRKDKLDVKLVELLERAPLEGDSFCEHFGKCGGCVYQTFDYDMQKKMKHEIVMSLFENADLKGFEDRGIIGSPEIYQYRNKMEYSFGDEEKDGPLTLGMHKKGRYHDVVTVDHCHLVHDDYNKVLRGSLDYFVESGLPKYNKKVHEGFLRHMVVKRSKKTGEILVALSASTYVEKTLLEEKLAGWVKMLRNLNLDGEIVGICYVKNDGMGDAVQGEYDVLYGRDYIIEEIFDLQFKISLYSFFQTNSEGTELLYKTALDLIDDMDGKVCLDLFSGTGTIGQIMSRKAKEVISIEIVPDAVASAKENAKINGITNCQFICGDVFEELNKIDVKVDVIVVDPPRVGMGEKAVHKVASYKVDEIVYVSCNPKSLVEDLQVFKKRGYRVENVTLVDMFPHTGHVETICLLKRSRK